MLDGLDSPYDRENSALDGTDAGGHTRGGGAKRNSPPEGLSIIDTSLSDAAMDAVLPGKLFFICKTDIALWRHLTTYNSVAWGAVSFVSPPADCTDEARYEDGKFL